MELVRNKVAFVLGVVLMVVVAAGVAAAIQVVQEVTASPSEAGETGPPRLAYPHWTPGTPGPPPWAGAEDGNPPPRLAHPDWKPGTPGPPPWAGADKDS